MIASGAREGNTSQLLENDYFQLEYIIIVFNGGQFSVFSLLNRGCRPIWPMEFYSLQRFGQDWPNLVRPGQGLAKPGQGLARPGQGLVKPGQGLAKAWPGLAMPLRPSL